MTTRIWIRITGFLLLVTAIHVGSVTAQVVKREKVREKIWFIARVVSTEPFMLEYVDDWYRHQPGHLRDVNHEVSTATNPQARTEDVRKFKLGDIIGGEFCASSIDDCPPAVNVWQPGQELSLPPNIAINLKRLGKEYELKYRRQGSLLTYRPDPRDLVQSMTIYRDGTVDIVTIGAGGLRRQLSENELKTLEKAFFADGTDNVVSSKSEGYFKLGLTTVFGKYRSFVVDQAAKRDIAFTSVLDDLIEKQMRTAIYRINYRWRLLIKDWKYGDTLPLDEAVDRRYRFVHWNALSQIKVPSELWDEARERYGEVNLHVYRYKGGFYTIQFGTCTDGSTGTWACYLAAGGGKPVEDGRVWGIYEEWPKDLQMKLEDIPKDGLISSSSLFGKGLDIPRSDVEKHREFFKALFNSGTGGASYREGEYIYSGLKVWIH